MCKYCCNLDSDSDGSEYGGNSWPVCELNMPPSNLKGFPFNKPPKSCIRKKAFGINKFAYPRAYEPWALEAYLCGELCALANLYRPNENKNCYGPSKCDAFRYILRRTDIKGSGFCNGLSAEQIQDVLKGRRFIYKKKRGGSEIFKISLIKKCSNCNGACGWPAKNIAGFDLCPECEGRGRIKVGTALP